MRVRAGSGWQTVLADLSLILFMLTASAVSSSKPVTPARPAKPASSSPREPARADPVAVYKPGAGAPPLAEWLAAQGFDPRQRLTIVVPYAAGREEAAIAQAGALAKAAAAPSRVIIEPGDPGDAYASLTFDMAQGLQELADKGQ